MRLSAIILTSLCFLGACERQAPPPEAEAGLHKEMGKPRLALPPAVSDEARNATLQGVDVNNNRVRDDVERTIGQKYGDTPEIEAVLQAVAWVMQYVGEKTSWTPDLAEEVLIQKAHFDNCLQAVAPGNAIAALNTLHREIFNTDERRLAFEAWRAAIPESVNPNTPPRVKACDAFRAAPGFHIQWEGDAPNSEERHHAPTP